MSQSTTNRLPYQIGAKNTAIHNKKMLINLPAGSGKSVIALDVAAESNCKRVLVVCPAFLKLNWTYEVRKWYPRQWHAAVTIQKVDDAIACRNMPTVFAVVGYPFFSKKGNTKFLQNQQWDMVICDESHFLRKWESTRCKNVILKIARMRERLLFLSATPLVTSAADLHPTFAVMQPGEWGKYWDFCEKYCNRVPDFFNPRGFRYEGLKQGTDIKKKARAFVFSAKKKEILKQLPAKKIIDLPVSVGKCQNFEGVEDMIDRLIDGDEDEEIKTERERIGKLKVQYVIDLLETFPENEQVVIFAWHRSVVLQLAKEIEGSEYIIGGMSEQDRMGRVTRFAEKGYRVLVVSIAAGGLGLNLQSASIAIFGELPYSHAEFEQCSDRIHRIGSAKTVRIYKIIAVGSIDEDINRAIERKQESAESAGVAT